ncbi:MFS general substrate transporter [Stereum hirsutum FP-91666 SS1]|uniref:MFS general substrate transporter n=1 Tax=Stereum hirsutum (strain FP-91666) TaxID=721885 RepID=UPI0004449D59|nr:MFS general substrate transporter [Stereum hirsutum FP-91666 SS1]EIM80934.1 MFS general substrate transporter [Stereum hirsutum FP-91666 SS1]
MNSEDTAADHGPPSISKAEEGLESTGPSGETPASALISDFPEGGRDGWLTVLGGALVLFSSFGAALSFGVFQDYYTRISLNEHSASQISWIGSTQLFLDFAVGLPAGKLFDEGHFRLLMISGTVLYSFSFFMLSLAKPHNYYQVFLSQAIGMGLGMGLVIIPAVSIPLHYFRRRRLLAMGFIFAGSSLGGVIFPIMLNKLINGRAGFAWGIRAAAFLSLGLLIIANLIMKPRLPLKKDRSPDTVVPLKSILTDVAYLISVFGAFLIFWGLFFPFFYLQLFSVLHGVDEKLAFYSLTVLNASTIFGRTIPNFASDKFGPLNVAIPMTTIAGGLVFAMLGATSVGGMFTFAVVYGFFGGACASRIGIAMFVCGFAILTGTPITGALLKPPQYNTWTKPVIFSAVVILAGVGCLVISRQMTVKRKGTWKV